MKHRVHCVGLLVNAPAAPAARAGSHSSTGHVKWWAVCCWQPGCCVQTIVWIPDAHATPHVWKNVAVGVGANAAAFAAWPHMQLLKNVAPGVGSAATFGACVTGQKHETCAAHVNCRVGTIVSVQIFRGHVVPWNVGAIVSPQICRGNVSAIVSLQMCRGHVTPWNVGTIVMPQT
jgi:hypothetical protein